MAKPEQRLVRQWLLIRALSTRPEGVSVQQLSRESQVSEKTIRRDLQVLARAGFPLAEQTGPHGKKLWKVQDLTLHPSIQFTLDEALAIYVGWRLMDPLAGTYLWQASRRALQKIRSLLTPTALAYLDRMAGVLYQTTVGQGQYAHKAELLDDLMVGIEDRRVVRVWYRSARARQPVTYRLQPYAMVMHRKSLYLIAHSERHNEVRHFKVDRLEKVELTRERFVLPRGFDIERHFSGSFGIFQARRRPIRVRIRFSPEAARYVQESHWHETQRFESCSDGGVILQLRLADTTEIKSWVLSFGARAEVLSPRSFREEVQREIDAMRRVYPMQAPNDVN